MKRTGLNTRKLFLLVLMVISAITVNAQEKKLTKEEKKAKRKQEIEASFMSLDSLLQSRRFVLVAEFLQLRTGERVNVNSQINFVKVNIDKATLQVGGGSGMGYNGLGGVTAEGEISSWKLEKTEKNHSFTLRFSISSIVGHYDILIVIPAQNYASATVTGLGPGTMTCVGHL